MESTEGRFCIDCGYQFFEDYGFCPRCGREYRVSPQQRTGSANIRTDSQAEAQAEQIQRAQQAYAEMAEQIQKQILESNRSFTIFMLIVWIAMSSTMSVALFMLLAGYIGSVEGLMGLGKIASFELALFASSCAAAAVSMITLVKRRYFNVSFYSCLASTIIMGGLCGIGNLNGFYFLLCGFLCTFRLRAIRAVFED
jgi:uncharacterized Zn finger protein (UPF0148 family)